MSAILSNITAGSMALRFARDTIDLVSMQVCREEGKAPHHPETVNPKILLNALKNILEIKKQLATAETRLNAVLDEVEVPETDEPPAPRPLAVVGGTDA